MRHGSLFSGIGGFDLAAEWMQWENVFHCEMNPFGRKVLNHYWPKSISYEDIKQTDFTIHRGKIDILTGGFPCQPYSTAGKRLGKEDDRHLWPEMLRAIREIQPTWVVGENVLGLVNWSGGLVFQEVQTDLEAEGYKVQPFILPAAGVNAPHKRDRVWFVAYSNHNRRSGRTGENESESKEKRLQKRNKIQQPEQSDNLRGFSPYTNSKLFQGRGGKDRPKETERHISSSFCGKTWENFPTQPPLCNGNDGFSTELDGITFPKWRNESIKAGGNAIVPQVALQIFKSIEQYDQTQEETM